MMRKGAKHGVGCTARGTNRGAAGREGDERRGKIRGKDGPITGEFRDARGGKTGRSVVIVGWWGVQGASSQHSQSEQTLAIQTPLFLMGEKLAVPWMFPCTFHFLNAVLSVHHLTSHQCLRKEPGFICCCT